MGGEVVVRVDGVETERHALTEANCPDLLCVRQGKIRYTGQSIICLPNRLTVTVEGGESDGVDAAVG